MRVLAVLLALLMVTACGRRGAPELPEGAGTGPRAPIDEADPEGPTAPDRPFPLDKLLQ